MSGGRPLPRARLALAGLAASLLAWPLGARAADARAIAEAERLAAGAIALAAASPEQALAQARRALLLSADFEPPAFVASGSKGEVVEDAYLAARGAYRRHRGGLYHALGRCLAASGRHAEAVRYLRRALELDGAAAHALALARSLVAAGSGREALAALLRAPLGPLDAATAAVAAEAADAAGLPSLQVEIDRVRLAALPEAQRPELRDGPLRLPERTRLSTGVLLDLGRPELTLVYNSEPSCRSCSADLEALRRALPPGARAIASGPSLDLERPLRQALALYRHDWPVVVGGGLDKALAVGAPSLVAVARQGLLVAVLRPPFAGLAAVVETLSQADVKEALPRARWNGRPAERRPLPPPPGLLPEGLAPGEDEPAPKEFEAALADYRAGRFKEALAAFEALEGRGDGWLLPPEARLDRALSLLGLGRREAARLLLLKTGDSRFQDHVDRALERAGSPSRGPSSNLRPDGREP